jgi:hypothetical protein
MDAPQPAGRKRVVHWLRPIAVNVEDLADLVPTVRLVKWTCMAGWIARTAATLKGTCSERLADLASAIR